MEFKGTQGDMQALINVKRSKVSKFIIQSSTMLGLGNFQSFAKLLLNCLLILCDLQPLWSVDKIHENHFFFFFVAFLMHLEICYYH